MKINQVSVIKHMGLGVTAAALLALAGCGQSQTNNTNNINKDNTNADANTSGHTENGGEQNTLRIATEGAYAPFNYTNADGSLGGFDVEIANALCAQMQVRCDVVAQDWDGIIPGLKAGKYDAIVAAMSVTPERQAQVDFTEPYFSNALVFLAKTDSRFDPGNASDLDHSSIAAQRSTISSQWMEQTYPQVELKLYDTLNNAFLDLGAGRVDAMVSDKLPALEWLNSDAAAGFEIKGNDIDINDNLAIAVRKDDALKDELNDALSAIKANGTYDDISEKYFAVTQGATPTQAEPAATEQTLPVATVENK